MTRGPVHGFVHSERKLNRRTILEAGKGPREVGQPGRDLGKAPGQVWPILPSPDWPDPNSKLTYRSKPLMVSARHSDRLNGPMV